MDSDYVAWNGERYVWPPPEGWYLASDGRWWAPDTGPHMDFDTPSAGSVAADAGAGYQAESVAAEIGTEHRAEPVDQADPVEQTSHVEHVESASSSPDAGHGASPIRDEIGGAPQFLPGPEPQPDLGTAYPSTSELDRSTAYPTGFAEPASAGPVSGQVAAVSDPDTTTTMAADVGSGGRHPTMVMAEPSRPGTGQHPTVAVDPDTGRHDRVPMVEPTEEAPSAGVQRSRTMPMVAAGLLVAAAIVIAALLALLGGDNETQTQQPSASAEEAEGDSSELVVSTDDEGTPTSADGAMDDGAMDGAMDDGAMDDGAMSDDDAMTDDGDATTSTTAVESGDATQNAALIGQFRTLLEENQITAAALTVDDLTVFAQTACSYATSAGDLPEYEQIRNEALNGAQNDELSIEELQFVVDAAVTVFCAEDATRLGLTATAPAQG